MVSGATIVLRESEELLLLTRDKVPSVSRLSATSLFKAQRTRRWVFAGEMVMFALIDLSCRGDLETWLADLRLCAE